MTLLFYAPGTSYGRSDAVAPYTGGAAAGSFGLDGEQVVSVKSVSVVAGGHYLDGSPRYLPLSKPYWLVRVRLDGFVRELGVGRLRDDTSRQAFGGEVGTEAAVGRVRGAAAFAWRVSFVAGNVLAADMSELARGSGVAFPYVSGLATLLASPSSGRGAANPMSLRPFTLITDLSYEDSGNLHGGRWHFLTLHILPLAGEVA